MNVTNNQIAKKEAPTTDQVVKVPEGLFFNILPFSHPQKQIDVPFSIIANSDMAKFSIDRLPEELQEQMLQKGKYQFI